MELCALVLDSSGGYSGVPCTLYTSTCTRERRELGAGAATGSVTSAGGGGGDPITDVNAHAVIRLDRRSQNESPQVLYLRKINPYLALSLVMPDEAYKNLCTPARPPHTHISPSSTSSDTASYIEIPHTVCAFTNAFILHKKLFCIRLQYNSEYLLITSMSNYHTLYSTCMYSSIVHVLSCANHLH